MKKLYRLLEWLNTEQAVDWLQDMTATQLTERELLHLCGARQCDLYICASGLEGVWFDADGYEQKCTGSGYQKVIARSFQPPLQHFQLEGQFWEHTIDQECYSGEGYWEATTEVDADYGIYFKPADVEALALKMNGIEEQAWDAKQLREQLQLEQTARAYAEWELLQLRQKRGTGTLTNIRHQLDEDKDFRSVLERAEAAERMVASMGEQLREQTEKMKKDGELFEHMAARAGSAAKTNGQPSETAAISNGLTFPYPTKHLEAMRDAAVRFWQEHDRNSPAPYGIQKKVQAFLAERTGENPRKLAELAAAIKPELPKT